MSGEAALSEIEDTGMATAEDLLSLEALLLSRTYAYTLFHKLYGGEPEESLIAVLGSQETEDVLDEYAAESETLGNLKTFARGLKRRLGDQAFLDDARDEFNRFFVGPADLPAPPWESTYVGNEAMVFQPSTLVVREAYRAQGFEAACCKRMPDDHVSIMSAFMAALSRKSLDTFRDGDYEHLSTLLADQHSFIREHLVTWLPEYARRSLRVKKALLYPQFAQGLAVFVHLDGIFVEEALQWVGKSISSAEALPLDPSWDSGVCFGKVESALSKLAALELRGGKDNELIPLA